MQDLYFPFDKIKRGSNVILYGAGENARKLWRMNQETSWCKIVACVDQKYEKIDDFPIHVDSPTVLCEISYDYVLISLMDEMQRNAVVDYLLGQNIPKWKIINVFLRSEKMILYLEEKRDGDCLRIGFHPMGVIGDCIISLKVYQEIVRLTDGQCEIDILNEYNLSFMKSVFYGQKCIHEIVNGDGEIKEAMLRNYDLVLDVRFEPSIVSLNLGRVEKLAPKLAHSMDILQSYQRHEYVDLPFFPYANRILLDRAKFLGLNRYTLFNVSKAFDIKDTNVDFYIDAQYESMFKSLELGAPYITYNFGANNQFKDGKKQTKMWPYEYHMELNRILKKNYPKIKIVQLGAANVEKIPGADRYILGKPLDVVKYVLKNSMFHFDCEGGLVHMASQLGTKCFVVFGPTPAWFLGYKNNENILPEICGECKGLRKDWYTQCYKYDRPECMYSIKPEKVFGLMSNYLHDQGY